MQPEVTDLKMTAQMRRDLREFLDGYGEDVLGRYRPNLILSNEPNFHRVCQGVDEATQTALDYPQDEERQPAPIWALLTLFILVGGLATLILFVCTVAAPWVCRCYLELKGC